MTHIRKRDRIVLSGCIIVNEDKEILLLYRDKHKHFETPGGKVRDGESLSEAARREVYEELGDDIRLAPLTPLGEIDFVTPDGRLAIANKFITSIESGTPRINEPELFSKKEWIRIDDLKDRPISPDLKLFLPILREKIKERE